MVRRIGPVVAFALLGCGDPDPGQLVLVVDSDMAFPKDLDSISIKVRNQGVPKFDNDFEGLGGEHAPFGLPATISLVGSGNADDTIQVTVSGRRGGKNGAPRVVRDVVTTVPAERVAELRVTLQYLCDGTAQEVDGEVVSTCADGETCVDGVCTDPAVDSGTLPDAGASPSTCLDVVPCFGVLSEVVVDKADCSSEPVFNANFAVETEGEGVCGPVGCFVALDANSDSGWRVRADGRVQFALAACDKAVRIVSAGITDSCPVKDAALPVCGPWSSGGGGAPYDGPRVLAGGQDNPLCLAVAPGRVYWGNAGSVAGQGALKSVGVEGGSPNIEASELLTVRDLMVHDGAVVWTTVDAATGVGAIQRLTGTEVSAVFGALGSAEGLAARGERVFWTEFGPSGAVQRGNLDGSGQVPLGIGLYPYRIVADDHHVYWTNEGSLGANDGSVVRFDIVGGDGLEVVADAQATPRELALDGDALYWTNAGGQLMRASVGPTLAAPEVLVDDLGFPAGVVVDETAVYWTNRDDGTLMRLAKAGSGQPTIIASDQRAPSRLVRDGSRLFWINDGTAEESFGAIVTLDLQP